MAQNLNIAAVINTAAAVAKPMRKPRASKKVALVAAAPLILGHVATTTLGEPIVGTMPDAGQDMLEALIGELDGAAPESDEVIEPAADAAPVAEVEETAVVNAEPVVIEVETKVIESADDGLDALLSELESLPVAASAAPAVETAAPAVEADLTDADVESAVATIEVREAMLAAATPDGVVGSATPTGDASDVSAEDLSAAAAAEGTAEGAGAKRTPVPRKHWSDKVERLKDRMGDSMGDYSVLTLDDAGVDPEALKARMEETIAIMKGMNKKQQARASFLIEFVSGRKAKLNEVLDRTLQVLHRDGFITTGKDGNVLANLLARPYSPGAARAMGGNTIGMFEDLKLIKADGKGRYVANPDSTLLMKVNSMLFPAAAA